MRVSVSESSCTNLMSKTNRHTGLNIVLCLIWGASTVCAQSGPCSAGTHPRDMALGPQGQFALASSTLRVLSLFVRNWWYSDKSGRLTLATASEMALFTHTG
jgi:hypothetical protein